MRRFVFPLDAALRQRLLREEAAKKELALALRGLNLCHDRLRVKEAELAAALDAPSSPPDAASFSLARAWIDVLRREHGAILHELGQHQKKVEIRQKELAAASREREALTRLKDRRHGEWLREGLAQEQAATDEVALQVVRRAHHG